MIAPLQNLQLPNVALLSNQSAEPATSSNFASLFSQVNDILTKADSMAAGYAQGKTDLTNAVLAAEKADTAFNLTMAVRNRALAAYQEIANMSV